MKKLNEMTTSELAEMLKGNIALFCELKHIADEYDTTYSLDDLFRHCPKGVDYNIGYPGEYVCVLRSRLTYSEEQKVVDWFCELAEDYCFLPDDFIPEAKKIGNYLSVLYDGVGKDKDRDFMEKAVSAFFDKAGDALCAEAKAINELFFDEYYLADCLLSCELIDDYFIGEDGAVYEERRPRKVG